MQAPQKDPLAAVLASASDLEMSGLAAQSKSKHVPTAEELMLQSERDHASIADLDVFDDAALDEFDGNQCGARGALDQFVDEVTSPRLPGSPEPVCAFAFLCVSLHLPLRWMFKNFRSLRQAPNSRALPPLPDGQATRVVRLWPILL